MGYGPHTPQNQPRWVVKKRDREQHVGPVWNSVTAAYDKTRRTVGWGKWRSLEDYRDEVIARKRHAALKRLHPLSEVGLFFRGRRQRA